MPALNFKARFAPLVESGQKRQTIRAFRKDRRDPKPGDGLFLFTGMPTKQCRRLRDAICTAVTHISIVHPEGFFLAGRLLCHEERQRMAEADGFLNPGEMAEWFDRVYGLPFDGFLIQW